MGYVRYLCCDVEHFFSYIMLYHVAENMDIRGHILFNHYIHSEKWAKLIAKHHPHCIIEFSLCDPPPPGGGGLMIKHLYQSIGESRACPNTTATLVIIGLPKDSQPVWVVRLEGRTYNTLTQFPSFLAWLAFVGLCIFLFLRGGGGATGGGGVGGFN